MEFSRQDYWDEKPFPSPTDLLDPEIKPRSPTLQADSSPSDPPGKPSNSSRPLRAAKPSVLAGRVNLLPVLALGLGKFRDSSLAFLCPCFFPALPCGQSLMSTWIFTSSVYLVGREGNGNPLQCSCLENPRDRGALWAAVYGVAQSWTRLKQLSSSSSSYLVGGEGDEKQYDLPAPQMLGSNAPHKCFSFLCP